MCGLAGRVCNRDRSVARASSGTRADSRCLRPLTLTMNASHAARSSSKEAYSSSRFASVGTRSAFATRTVASVPPLDAGSAGRHVLTLTE